MRRGRSRRPHSITAAHIAGGFDGDECASRMAILTQSLSEQLADEVLFVADVRTRCPEDPVLVQLLSEARCRAEAHAGEWQSLSTAFRAIARSEG